MCPDKETLSAYVDNEIPEEFDIKITEHLSECKACAQTVQEMRELSLECKIDSLDVASSKHEVWNKIRNNLDYKKPASFWDQRISVPVPYLAAAAAVFIAVTAFSVFNLFIAANISNYSNISVIESAPISGEDEYKYFQYEQILDVDLKLPENTIFIISGAPQLIKEVDYTGSSR